MKSLRLAIPFFVFLAMCVLFYFMLDRDTELLPSPLIGKPMPEFTLTQLSTNQNNLASAEISNKKFEGQKWLLNIWASWCAACTIEHPLFNQIHQQTDWMLVGLNYKDQSQDAKAWLQRMQDPYQNIIYDPEGSLGLDLGVYGVPETFLIDEQGIIQYKHVGPICPDIIEKVISPFFQGQGINTSERCENE